MLLVGPPMPGRSQARGQTKSSLVVVGIKTSKIEVFKGRWDSLTLVGNPSGIR